MLTDEELTTRLSAAFEETAPDLTYAGPVPHVRRSRAGLAASSALVATAALVLVPVTLQREDARTPDASAGPQERTGPTQGPRVVRTLDLGGLRLSFATTGADPGPLYAVLGDDLEVPDGAEKLDLDAPGQYWFVENPDRGQPQVYVGQRTCPDTSAGCDGRPPHLEVYGILAPGWTRAQLVKLLEHPASTERNATRADR